MREGATAVRKEPRTREEREEAYKQIENSGRENGAEIAAALRYAETLTDVECPLHTMAEIIGGGTEVTAGFSGMLAEELSTLNFKAVFSTMLLLCNMAYERGRRSLTETQPVKG